MVSANNPIKNISCYNIIILLIITIFSSFKCYSMNNNEILALYQETAINTKAEPDKPPPSYEDAISGRSNNVLPTYQQVLIMGNESRVTQEDTTLIETENYNLAQATTINIPIEHPDIEINYSSCFHKFLKKHKKTIQTRILPCVIVLVMLGILITLEIKKITRITILVGLPIVGAYIVYDRVLRKKYFTN